MNAVTADAFRQLFDGSFILAAIFSRDGVLLEANPSALYAGSETPERLYGKHFSDIEALSLGEANCAQFASMLARAGAGETVRGELTVRLAGARIAFVDAVFVPLRDVAGRVVQIGATGVEITAHKSAESTLGKLNRELRMLTSCTQVLMRADDEQELLREICRVIVDEGGYRFSWVGLAENDAEQSVRPVASAGTDAGYLERLRISWGDSAHGQGPTGLAIRLRMLQTCGDIETDPAFEPWREDAQRCGYACSVALPLIIGQTCIGALNIYSGTAPHFDAAELALLSELASDIAYGVAGVRTRAEHRRAETQLQLFRWLLDRSADMIYVVDAQTGRILDASDAVSRQLGYARDELLAMKLADFSVSAAERPWQEQVARVAAAGSLVLDGQHRRRDGSLLPVEISLSYVEQNGARYLISVTRDISEQKHQQALIERMTRVRKLQSAVNSAVLRIRERDYLLQEACRLATQLGGYDRAVVSVVEPDGKRARPSFRAGREKDFPEPDYLEIGDGTEPDGSATSRALRTGQIVVCNDLTQSEPPVAMRERLLALGFKTVVALPLIVDGSKVGVLTLTSKDPTLITDDELLLLQDMTASLSFALRSQQQAAAFEFLASYDSLTGLAKRPLFCQRLEGILVRCIAAGHKPAVAAVDVHLLSNINDTFGRHFGDLLLQSVAERLKDHVENDEYVGYLGGGAFVVVELDLATSAENINSLLENTVFGEAFSIEGRELRLSCRSGVARFPVDGRDSDTLVRNAEAALKRAKEIGEPYLHYRLDMHSEIAERLALEHRLRLAIDAEQFELHYQPQISTATGRIESVEALLRWNDPEHGIVAPAQFLPVLESSGLIVAAGNWTLTRVAADCRRWRDLGLGPVRVGVNVSALQLRRRSFVDFVLGQVGAWSTEQPGYGIDLEITETALLQDIEGTSRKLRELRAAGIRIALDDFGTGYSSLGLLSKLPVDLLKIDRSFVADLPGDHASVTLAKSIIALAAAFGLLTVAEGVETEEQLELLRSLNCDYTQGYLHRRPMPVAELEKVLARQQAADAETRR